MKLTAVATYAFITFIVLAAVAESRADIIAFTTDFNCASPGQFSGCANSIEGVQGYSGLVRRGTSSLATSYVTAAVETRRLPPS